MWCTQCLFVRIRFIYVGMWWVGCICSIMWFVCLNICDIWSVFIVSCIWFVFMRILFIACFLIYLVNICQGIMCIGCIYGCMMCSVDIDFFSFTHLICSGFGSLVHVIQNMLDLVVICQFCGNETFLMLCCHCRNFCCIWCLFMFFVILLANYSRMCIAFVVFMIFVVVVCLMWNLFVLLQFVFLSWIVCVYVLKLIKLDVIVS